MIVKNDSVRLTEGRVDRGLEYFEKSNHGDRLNGIYGQIPGGSCTGCAKCCVESVNTSYAEFMNIVGFMKGMVIEKKVQLVERIVSFYSNELSNEMDCPFLGDANEEGFKPCAIYGVRPLECRVFGSLPRREYEDEYSRVLELNRHSAELFRDYYGDDIPLEIVERKIGWCESYVPQSPFSVDEKKMLIDLLMEIDMEYIEKGHLMEDELGGSLVHWFGRMAFSEDAAEFIRVESVREKSKQK